MCQLLLEAPSNRQKHLCESCTAMLVKFKITENYWRLEEVCPPLRPDYIRIRSVTPAESETPDLGYHYRLLWAGNLRRN